MRFDFFGFSSSAEACVSAVGTLKEACVVTPECGVVAGAVSDVASETCGFFFGNDNPGSGAVDGLDKDAALGSGGRVVDVAVATGVCRISGSGCVKPSAEGAEKPVSEGVASLR